MSWKIQWPLLGVNLTILGLKDSLLSQDYWCWHVILKSLKLIVKFIFLLSAVHKIYSFIIWVKTEYFPWNKITIWRFRSRRHGVRRSFTYFYRHFHTSDQLKQCTNITFFQCYFSNLSIWHMSTQILNTIKNL